MHHVPAKQFAQKVRLSRQHHFRHLRARRADRLPLSWALQSSVAVLAAVLDFLRFINFLAGRILESSRHPL